MAHGQVWTLPMPMGNDKRSAMEPPQGNTKRMVGAPLTVAHGNPTGVHGDSAQRKANGPCNSCHTY